MGCKQSRQVKVQPVGPKETDKAKLRKCMSDNDPIEYDIDERSKRRDRNRRKKQKKSLGSNDSLDDDVSLGSDRGGSAGSKGSKKSDDSGLDMGEENHGFITEYSDPDKVKEIESNFKERDGLDLGITGTQLPTRNSAKDKARLEESMVLQKLRDEGLISKPAAEKSGGVSFEIFEVNSGQRALPSLPGLPPLKLAKLEKRRKKKKSLTEEEIKEKLQRAEQRRKKKEQARLEKIKEMDKTDQTAALESFAEYQKKKEETVTQKIQTVNDNRERRLREVKEKAKERERRREEVRRRKQLRKEMAMQEGENEEKTEIVGDASELLPRQETPIVPV